MRINSLLLFITSLFLISCSSQDSTPPTATESANSDTPYTYLSGENFQNRKVYYQVDGHLGIAEGDIVLGYHTDPKTGEPGELQKRKEEMEAQQQDGTRAAVATVFSSQKWQNGIIPYVFAQGGEFGDSSILPFYDTTIIDDIANSYEQDTPIRLVPYDSSVHTEYVLIYSVDSSNLSCGGAATVGRRANRISVFRMSTGCGAGLFSREEQLGIALHELGHTSGLYHEQSREDRDDFVTINFQNVQPAAISNFEQRLYDGDDIGPYDYLSIMHYTQFTFSQNGLPTITTTDPSFQSIIGNTNQLSDGDIAALDAIYGLKTTVLVSESEEEATITWKTGNPGSSRVDIGLTPDNLNLSFSGSVSKNHSVELTGLTPQTKYFYRVFSKVGNNDIYSAVQSFFTDVTGPEISDISIINVSFDRAEVTWTTDELAVGRVQIFDSEGNFVKTFFDNDILSTSHSILVDGLIESSDYTALVISYDQSINEGLGEDVFQTIEAPEIIISNIQVQVSRDWAVVSWETNLPTLGDVIYLGGGTGSQSATDSQFSTLHSVLLSNLLPGTLYQFDIGAYFDENLNGLTATEVMEFTTDALPADVVKIERAVGDLSLGRVRVSASSSIADGGQTQLTFKITSFGGNTIIQRSMSYRSDLGWYEVEIPFSALPSLIFGAEASVESSRGGRDTFMLSELF